MSDVKEKISVSDFFKILTDKYGLEIREKQPIMSNYFSLPLFEGKEEEGRNTAVIEGETGIGKTLAYLVPILLAQKGLLDERYIPNHPAYIGKMDEITNQIMENLGSIDKEKIIEGEIKEPNSYKLIISTSSKLLQNQLINKDLPFIQKVFKQEFNINIDYATAVGASNYICADKIKNFIKKYDDVLEGKSKKIVQPSTEWTQLYQIATKINKYIEESVAKGTPHVPSFDEVADILNYSEMKFLKEYKNDDVQPFLPTSSQISKKCMECKAIQGCHYYDMMSSMQKTDIIIGNHHWFAYNVIKPYYIFAKSEDEEEKKMLAGKFFHSLLENRIIVIDEAHMFEKALSSALSTEVSWKAFKEDLIKFNDTIKTFHLKELGISKHSSVPVFKSYLEEIVDINEKILKHFKTFEQSMDTFHENLKKRADKDIQKKLKDSINKTLKGNILSLIVSLKAALDDLSQFASKNLSSGVPLNLYLVYHYYTGNSIDPFVQRFKNRLYKMDQIANKHRLAGYALSLTKTGISLTPVRINNFLKRSKRWDNQPKIFCSATITVAESDNDKELDPKVTLDPKHSFRYICNRLGLNADRVVSVHAKSPFPYHENMIFFQPSDAPEMDLMKNKEKIVEYMEDTLYKLSRLTNGGVLALFTSYDLMETVYSRIADDLKDAGLSTGMQGEYSIKKLVSLFKKPNSVVFGVESMWQGLDVQGQNLRNLIITKLPFDSPDDPILQEEVRGYRSYLINQKGMSYYEANKQAFKDIQLPRAALMFKQGIGRLIRSTTDKGILTVLDRRIFEKGFYRNIFLNAIPEDVVGFRDWNDFLNKAVEIGLANEKSVSKLFEDKFKKEKEAETLEFETFETDLFKPVAVAEPF